MYRCQKIIILIRWQNIMYEVLNIWIPKRYRKKLHVHGMVLEIGIIDSISYNKIKYINSHI